MEGIKEKIISILDTPSSLKQCIGQPFSHHISFQLLNEMRPNLAEMFSGKKFLLHVTTETQHGH